MSLLDILSPAIMSSLPVWEHLFQSVASFEWKRVRFQRTEAALDVPEPHIASIRLHVRLHWRINRARHTPVWVWERHITP